jgi:hypothetical protein
MPDPALPRKEQVQEIARLITEWVHCEWELREFSEITVSEGQAIKARAVAIAEHLQPRLSAHLRAVEAAHQQAMEKLKASPHEPPHVHHCCEPSNLAGAPPFGVYCRHTQTWIDGAAQQDDYECPRCKTRITVNVSEWRAEAAEARLSALQVTQERQG